MSNLKSLKGGKTEIEPDVRKRKLRGVEFEIRELSVPEYKACLKDATNAEGVTPFQDLLDMMVLRAVSPSPASFSKPLPYPVYRTLEDDVNVMHFINLKDDADDPAGADDEEDSDAVVVPNS